MVSCSVRRVGLGRTIPSRSCRSEWTRRARVALPQARRTGARHAAEQRRALCAPPAGSRSGTKPARPRAASRQMPTPWRRGRRATARRRSQRVPVAYLRVRGGRRGSRGRLHARRPHPSPAPRASAPRVVRAPAELVALRSGRARPRARRPGPCRRASPRARPASRRGRRTISTPPARHPCARSLSYPIPLRPRASARTRRRSRRQRTPSPPQARAPYRRSLHAAIVARLRQGAVDRTSRHQRAESSTRTGAQEWGHAQRRPPRPHLRHRRLPPLRNRRDGHPAPPHPLVALSPCLNGRVPGSVPDTS